MPTNSSIQNTIHINPNFAEDKMEISFTISKQTLLNIKMTDILGNEPFSLFNESVAAGEFKRNFNLPIKLAKGLYLHFNKKQFSTNLKNTFPVFAFFLNPLQWN